MAISDDGYNGGLRRLESELADPEAPKIRPDHLCLITVRGDKNEMLQSGKTGLCVIDAGLSGVEAISLGLQDLSPLLGLNRASRQSCAPRRQARRLMYRESAPGWAS